MNWVNIGSDNGLSRPRRQAIIWTNAGMLECWNIAYWTLRNQTSEKFLSIFVLCLSKRCIRKCRLLNGCHFVQGEMSWLKMFSVLQSHLSNQPLMVYTTIPHVISTVLGRLVIVRFIFTIHSRRALHGPWVHGSPVRMRHGVPQAR